MHAHFIDLPVYRISRKEYEAAREARIAKQMKPWDRYPSAPKDARTAAEDSARRYDYEAYGPWDFNEIVGYVRLHFYGNQIRGEYVAVNRKRLVLTRNKVLVYRTHKLVHEQTLSRKRTSASILKDVQSYVQRCHLELKGRHLDDTWLNTVGPHIDWVALHKSTNGFSAP